MCITLHIYVDAFYSKHTKHTKYWLKYLYSWERICHLVSSTVCTSLHSSEILWNLVWGQGNHLLLCHMFSIHQVWQLFLHLYKTKVNTRQNKWKLADMARRHKCFWFIVIIIYFNRDIVNREGNLCMIYVSKLRNSDNNCLEVYILSAKGSFLTLKVVSQGQVLHHSTSFSL